MERDQAGLRLDNLTKRFDEVVAVDGLDLEVSDGEFVTLLGPSGCGKTTALRLIAGFESPDAGRVVFRRVDVTSQSPQKRGFGMVFQNYALFPHLSVFENVAFGLRAHGADRAAIEASVEEALARVNLTGFGPRRVQQLSGGQQQRIALARALAIRPPLLLLDEPLSNLDAALRERTRTELRTLIKQLGITAVFVTHDQEEAFDLSDRVAVLRDGRLHQIGTPEELYRHPVDRFVAGFVGRANVLEGRVESVAPGRVDVALPFGRVWSASCGDLSDVRPGATVELILRPEDVEISDPGSEDSRTVGIVRDVRYRGALTSYRVELEGPVVLEATAGSGLAAVGDRVSVRPGPEARPHLFSIETS